MAAVMGGKSGSWLESTLFEARDAGWCTSPYCTTCGAMEFRRAYWAAAGRQAGVEGHLEAARRPRDILADVSAFDHDALVRALVAGLRELQPPMTNWDAFRTIILDLDPQFIKHGVAISLDSSLSGTPAGEALARMRAHAAALRAKHEKIRDYEGPEAVAERRRASSKDRAAAQVQRRFEKQRRNLVRLELLEALGRLGPAARLSRFAADPELILDGVPSELIPACDNDLSALTRTETSRLISRIGRRKGAWGRLRRLLEDRMNESAK